MAPKSSRMARGTKFVCRPVKTVIDPIAALGNSLQRLQGFFNAATTLKPSPLVFNMDKHDDKVQLATLLYSHDYSFLEGRMAQENPELCMLLAMLTDNTYTPTPARREIYEIHKRHLYEGLLSSLYRMRSQKCMTFLTAALSIEAYKTHAATTLIDTICCFFRGVTASTEWVADFVPFALKFQPARRHAPIPGFALTAFDNLQIRVGYKAYSTEETKDTSTNYRLDMTNSMELGMHPSVGAHLGQDTLREIGELSPNRGDARDSSTVTTTSTVAITHTHVSLAGSIARCRSSWASSVPHGHFVERIHKTIFNIQP